MSSSMFLLSYLESIDDSLSKEYSEITSMPDEKNKAQRMLIDLIRRYNKFKEIKNSSLDDRLICQNDLMNIVKQHDF